jgi:tartrate dehydratase beta subunit/fumarate hydratase class I family protein
LIVLVTVQEVVLAELQETVKAMPGAVEALDWVMVTVGARTQAEVELLHTSGAVQVVQVGGLFALLAQVATQEPETSVCPLEQVLQVG